MGCAASAPAAEVTADEASARIIAVARKAETAKALPTKATSSDTIKAGITTNYEPADAEKQRSKKSRARRLSYVDHSGETKTKLASLEVSHAEEGEASDGEQETETPMEAAAKKRSKGARRRRLSYVVGEKEANIKSNFSLAPVIENDNMGDELTPEEAKIKEMLEQNAVPSKPVNAASDQDGKIAFSMACISRAGREPGFKKQNQDNCFAFEKYMQQGQALFGAFDGHGPEGHTVSAYIKQHLPKLLVNHLGPTCADVPSALRNCFLDLDKAMTTSKIDCEFSGSTACVAHLNGRMLNVAWVGDSRGVLGRAAASGVGFEAVPMTIDHKPTNPDEKARILANSGRVERLVDESGQPIGPFRVWLQYAWIPGLAMSRALGDALAHQVGVTSEPDVFTHTLTPQDAFIILASDGVWEFIDSQAAVNIVGSSSSAEEGCRQLVDEAFQRWLVEEEGVVDDITAVVVKLSYPK